MLQRVREKRVKVASYYFFDWIFLLFFWVVSLVNLTMAVSLYHFFFVLISMFRSRSFDDDDDDETRQIIINYLKNVLLLLLSMMIIIIDDHDKFSPVVVVKKINWFFMASQWRRRGKRKFLGKISCHFFQWLIFFRGKFLKTLCPMTSVW